jgi:hypothetical protein
MSSNALGPVRARDLPRSYRHIPAGIRAQGRRPRNGTKGVAPLQGRGEAPRDGRESELPAGDIRRGSSGVSYRISRPSDFQKFLLQVPKRALKPGSSVRRPCRSRISRSRTGWPRSGLLEKPSKWLVHGFNDANNRAELCDVAQSEIYKGSSPDPRLYNAFCKMRQFLVVTPSLSEDEAMSLMSVAVDFGITQVVDGKLVRTRSLAQFSRRLAARPKRAGASNLSCAAIQDPDARAVFTIYKGLFPERGV